MRRLAAAVLALGLFVSHTASASQEQIHRWKTVSVVAPTDLFGDVEVNAGADAKGNVTGLSVRISGATIGVPATWIATLPAVPLASLEVRSEKGMGSPATLYVVFKNGPTTVAGSVMVHVWFQAGKLAGGSVTTYDGKGGSKWDQRKAP
jgi:hypothetical protein